MQYGLILRCSCKYLQRKLKQKFITKTNTFNGMEKSKRKQRKFWSNDDSESINRSTVGANVRIGTNAERKQATSTDLDVTDTNTNKRENLSI